MARDFWEQARKQINQRTAHYTVVIGFDAFIDTIVQPVATRIDRTTFIPIDTISAFAQRIAAAANKSCNIELVVKQQKLGGNAPILANALAALGEAPSLIAPVGAASVHPLFVPLQQKCTHIISLGDPGSTDALEFSDGKIMLGKHASLLDITAESIETHCPDERLCELLHAIDLFASVNWTMILAMTKVWKFLAEKIFPKISPPKWTFVDLADPAKRPPEDILAALSELKKMQPASQVILGLNEQESRQVLQVYGVDSDPAMWSKGQMEQYARILLQKSNLSMIVIHSLHFAAAAFQDDAYSCDGFYTPTPKLTTGAGDNFNAGFLCGLLHELPLASALRLGTAVSGYYARFLHSPTLDELTEFLAPALPQK